MENDPFLQVKFFAFSIAYRAKVGDCDRDDLRELVKRARAVCQLKMTVHQMLFTAIIKFSEVYLSRPAPNQLALAGEELRATIEDLNDIECALREGPQFGGAA